MIRFLVAALAFSATAVQAEPVFEMGPDTLYTVSVHIHGGTSPDPDLVDALTTRGAPEGARGRLWLRALDGATLVDIIAWQDPAAADAFAPPYLPVMQVYWRRDYRLESRFAKDGAGFTITPESAVQWSEFLMRDPAVIEDLAFMVEGMTETMVLGGPDTLTAIHNLRAEHDLAIGLLGLWSTREGFKVFAEEQTFGDQPYWSDSADNAHWMMEVVSIH